MKRLLTLLFVGIGAFFITHPTFAALVQQSPDPAVVDSTTQQRLFVTYPGLIAQAYLFGFLATIFLIVLTLRKDVRTNALGKTALIIFYATTGFLILLLIAATTVNPISFFILSYQYVFWLGVIPALLMTIALFLMIGALHELKKKALMIVLGIITLIFLVSAAAMGAFYWTASHVRSL